MGIIITVVIPVYNEEKYIEECIKSVSTQTYTNLDIIIVDDGSNDNSIKIAEKHAKCDSRIKIISINHGGVSNARNVGIDQAKGDYIIFVDADDYLDKRMVQTLYDKIQSTSSEMAICNMYRIKGENIIAQYDEYDKIFDFKNFNKNEYIVEYLLYKHSYCVWNRIYSLKLIKDNRIYFINNIDFYPEDLLFNLSVLLYVNKVAWVNNPLYFHISRVGSLTNTYRKNITVRYFNLCKEYYNLLLKTKKENKLICSFNYLIQNIVIADTICLIRNNKFTLKELYCEIKKMRSYNFFKDALKDRTFNRKNSLEKIVISLLSKKMDVLFILILVYIVKFGKEEKLVIRAKESTTKINYEEFLAKINNI